MTFFSFSERLVNRFNELTINSKKRVELNTQRAFYYIKKIMKIPKNILAITLAINKMKNDFHLEIL